MKQNEKELAKIVKAKKVLEATSYGAKSFSEIKRKLHPITAKVLSYRLKTLIKNKLVKRKISAKIMPVKSQYQITRLGQECLELMIRLETLI